MKVKGVTDVAIGASLCILLMIISIYVPIISTPSAFLCGIPLMYVAYKWGLLYGILAVICSAFGTFILTANIITPLLLVLSYGLPAAVFGFTANKGFKFYTSLAMVTVFVLIGNVVQLMIINGSGDGIKTLLDVMTKDAQSAIGTLLSENITLTDLDINSLLKEAMQETVNSILFYLPAISIIASAIMAYLISMTGVFFLNRLTLRKVNYIKFNMIKVPKITVIVFVLMFIIIDISNFEIIYMAALKNLLVISAAAIIISGFSYVDYILSKKIKSGYLRVILYLGIWIVGFALIPFVVELFFVLGLFDSFTNKRIPQIIGDDKIEKE